MIITVRVSKMEIAKPSYSQEEVVTVGYELVPPSDSAAMAAAIRRGDAGVKSIYFTATFPGSAIPHQLGDLFTLTLEPVVSNA